MSEQNQPFHHPGQGNMKPGDEAPSGTPGAGENICPDCSGSGKRNGRPCETCAGTGKVTTGVGGA